MSRKHRRRDRRSLEDVDERAFDAMLALGNEFDRAKRKGVEQTGSLELVNAFTWRFRWRDPPDPETGHRRRRSAVIGTLHEFDTRQKAWAEVERRRPYLMQRRVPAGASPTFEAVCKDYREQQLVTMGDETRRAYGSIIDKVLVPEFGKVHVHELTLRPIRAWMNAQLNAHREGKRRASRKTRTLHRDCLRSILRFAQDQGLDVYVPEPSELKIASGGDPATTIRDKAYPLTEAEQLLDAAARAVLSPVDPFPVILALLHYSGLRSGEARALAWQNVDVGRDSADPQLRVRANANASGRIGSTKTPSGVRDVPIPSELLATLRAYHQALGRPIGGLLFPGRTPESALPYSGLAKRFERLCERLSLECRGLHGFRHAYAMSIADARMPIAKMLELCGWSSLKSAMPYLRASGMSSREVVDRALEERRLRQLEGRVHDVHFSSKSEMAPRKGSTRKNGARVVELPNSPENG